MWQVIPSLQNGVPCRGDLMTVKTKFTISSAVYPTDLPLLPSHSSCSFTGLYFSFSYVAIAVISVFQC